jgi:hypothetical protein
MQEVLLLWQMVHSQSWKYLMLPSLIVLIKDIKLLLPQLEGEYESFGLDQWSPGNHHRELLQLHESTTATRWSIK